MIMRQQHDCHQPPSSKRSSSSLSSFFCALSEPRHDPARRPTGKQCPLNCCNYQTRDSIDGCVSKNAGTESMVVAHWWVMMEAAPRCYLSPSGWCAATPPSLIYGPPSPKWRKHVMARYYSANDKTQPQAKTAEEQSNDSSQPRGLFCR